MLDITWKSIPEHQPNPEECKYLTSEGMCYWCCETCNVDRHQCHECGDNLNHFDQNLDHTEHACYSHKNGYEL